MEQKPLLKTIEVIDSRTGSVCKVACMTCIRGHRTTSCGRNICRSKLFWTVKRPGRPANACTCPLGSTGRCKCVLATTACPHRKSKNGDARPVDCRCDEQGRWCCLLDESHWAALLALQNPTVDFYPTPEALNAARTASTNGSFPSTPSFSAGTPQTMSSLPSTPDPLLGLSSMNMDMSPLKNFQSPTYQTPRFGMMGLGSPLGGDGHVGDDVLAWDGHAPQAPREFQPLSALNPMGSGDVPPSIPMDQTLATQPSYPDVTDQQYLNLDFDPVTRSFEDMTMQTQNSLLPPLQVDKMMEDYYNYQFPGSICQNCGLSGCNCKACPALMQSSVDGSWAQCCSRKHVRTAELAQHAMLHSNLIASEQQTLQPFVPNTGSDLVGDGQGHAIAGMRLGGDQPFSPSLDDLGLPDDAQPMDFTEFVMSDPDPPSHGCCCGGDT